MADALSVLVGLAAVAIRLPNTGQENQVLTNVGQIPVLLESVPNFVLTAAGSAAAVTPGASFTPGSKLRLVKNSTPLYANSTLLGIAVAAPAVPASGTPQTNTTGADVAVTVTGGTVTAIAVNGVAVLSGVSLGGSVVAVPAGGTITLTYSSAPTWTWNSGQKAILALSAGVQAT